MVAGRCVYFGAVIKYSHSSCFPGFINQNYILLAFFCLIRKNLFAMNFYIFIWHELQGSILILILIILSAFSLCVCASVSLEGFAKGACLLLQRTFQNQNIPPSRFTYGFHGTFLCVNTGECEVSCPPKSCCDKV